MAKTARTLLLGAIAVNFAAYAAQESPAPLPSSTPPGVTIVNVTKLFPSSIDQFMWRRLGDEHGKPLYTFQQDVVRNQSTCIDTCAREFTPFISPKDAHAFGDWTLVKRPDTKDLQWAYQGKPLYRYSGTDPAGNPLTTSTASADREDPDWHDPGSKFYSPKKGWTRAAYTPEKTFNVPPGIALASLAVANGFGLVDAMTRMTIYSAPVSRKMSRAWAPVYAPELATPLKDFTIASRQDGTHQWTYKGNLLYTFVGDYSEGDINGSLAENPPEVALVFRNFTPPEIVVKVLTGHGPLMMTKDGLSVYTQARYNLQYGGRETRTGYSIPYNAAKSVGARGCTNDCLKTWKPLTAPNGAVGGGYWEVVSRADGSNQWAFKGSALYTYVGDRKTGDTQGNNRHDIVYGDREGKVDMSVVAGEELEGEGLLGDVASMESGSGFYWHTATLYY